MRIIQFRQAVEQFGKRHLDVFDFRLESEDVERIEHLAAASL